MTTYTVKQSGGDFTSLAAAVEACSGGETISIEGFWTIPDTSPVVIPTGVNNLLIKIGDADAAHSGYWNPDQNHYRLVVSGSSIIDHCISINGTGTIIDGLAMNQAGTGASTEGIRVSNSGTNTIRNCLITSEQNATDGDGIYFSYTSNCTIHVENCIIYGFNRRGIGFDQTNTQSYAAYLNVNSCLIINNGSSGEGLSAGIGFYTSKVDSTSKPLTVKIHNSVIVGNIGYDLIVTNGLSRVSPVNYSIDVSYSIDSDGSIGSTGITSNNGNLSNRTVTDNPNPGTGNWVIFEDISNAPYDYRIVDSDENDILDAHSTQTAEGITIPNTDILGAARPDDIYYDIGPFEYEHIVHNLVGDNVVITPTVEKGALGQGGKSILIVPEISNGTLGQVHALGGFTVSVTPEVSKGTLTHIHALVGNNVVITPVVEFPWIGQTHILSGEDIVVEPIVDNGEIGQTHILYGENVLIEPIVDNGEIGQTHILYGETITITPEVSTGILAETPTLVGKNLTITPEISVGTIGQTHILSAEDIVIQAIVEHGEIGQTHVLFGEDIAITPEVSTGIVGNIHILNGLSIEVQPEIAKGDLTHIHALGGRSVTIQPSITKPTLHLVHVLFGENVIAVPTIENGIFHQVHALSGKSVLVTPIITKAGPTISIEGGAIIFYGIRPTCDFSSSVVSVEKVIYKPIVIFSAEE